MSRNLLLIFILIFLSCNQEGSTDANKLDGISETSEIQLPGILLTETKLGELDLEKLKENNIRAEINDVFPGFLVTKTVGQQDGPDFNLYKVSHSGEGIFFISIDSEDTTRVQELRTNNKVIKDVYGISAGQKIEYALEKRPALKFHSDLHYNIYATDTNSKIEYRLTGNFKFINDTAFVTNDYSVAKWQVEEMEIEYLIWKK